MEEQFWNRRFFILITGASRGFGRTLAHTFSSKVSKDSQIIILGRNKEKLESVKEEIKNDNSNISVNTVNIDLAKPNAAEFQKILEPFKETNYDVYILINNVGSVGDISKDASSFNDNEELTKYYELNVNSPIVMTSVFLKLFKTSGKNIVVNISSLAALQPFDGWTLYCTGKAARDMYFKVLAQEESEVSVLNYAPGPMDTDMMGEIIAQAKPDIRDWALKSREEKSFVNMTDSANKLCTWLSSGKYKSGSHIDVFDPLT